MDLSLEQASNLAELVGVTLVIVSIFYLTVQVRQNTKAMRIQTVHDLSAMYIEVQSSIAQNKEMMALMQRGQFDHEVLDQQEKARFGLQVAALLRMFGDLHYQHLQGTLDQSQWLGFKCLVEDAFSYPGFQAVWNIRRHHHSEEFQLFVDNAIANPAARKASLYPDPKAKSLMDEMTSDERL
jgi:hypothetical protein